MQLRYTKRFVKDIEGLKDKSVRLAILNVIEEMKNADRLDELRNVKKLHGAKNAYRARIGEFRIGFYFEAEIIILGRCADRKELYRIFP